MLLLRSAAAAAASCLQSDCASCRSTAAAAASMAQWHTTDVRTVTTTTLKTTGGTVWSAAHVCCSYLEAVAEAVGLTQPGIRVLELGSGCGWLGLVVARNAPHAAEVCLTEQAYGGALEHLRRNVTANPGLQRNVTCRAFDWTHAEDPAIVASAAAAAAAAAATSIADAHDDQQEGPSRQELLDLHALLNSSWDLIIGSDLVYNTAGAHALPRVLATLLPPRPPHETTARAPGPVAFYAHTKHRYDHLDELLFACLAAEGLSVEEVVAPGKELPPPSPPLFSSLFPDMRCAVFRISRQ